MAARNRARKSSAFYLPRARDLFYPSRDRVLDNFKIFFILSLFPLIAGLGNGVLAIPTHFDKATSAQVGASLIGGSNVPGYIWGFAGLGLVIAVLLGFAVQIMSHAAQLEAAKGGKVTFSHLWTVVKSKGLQLAGLYIVAGMMILVGLVLFIIPGLILLRRYYLAPYVLLDNNVDVWRALQKSAAISKRNTHSVWGVIGIQVLISLLGIIPLIGWIFSYALGLLYSVAPALRYEQLKKLS